MVIGVAGAFVVVTAAGSRRTSSAYDRFLDVTEPFDVIAVASCDEQAPPDGAECDDRQAKASEVVRSLPEVADVAVALNYLVPILKEDGSSIQPEEAQDACFTGSGEVDVVGSFDERLGTTIMRRRYIEGRAADPSRADEVVVSLAAARREGIEVGDRLSVVPVEACDGPPEAEWPDPIDVTVVGLHLSPGEVQPERGLYLQSVTVTPRLLDDLRRRIYFDQPGAMVVRLAEDATADEFVAAAARAGYPVEVALPHDELAAQVREGLRPDAFGLGLLSVLGAVITLIVLSQAIGRQLWAGAGDYEQLRAMGFTARGLARIGLLQAGAVGLAAGVVTVALAVLASPSMPIGRARTIEPHPGMDVDVAAMSLGALGVAGLTTVIGFAASWWIARRALSTGSRGRVSRLAGILSAAGASPQLVCGARSAFERQHGARAVPLISGLGGAIVGIGALVGALTFSSSLEHLLTTPRLVGWNWDGMAFIDEETTEEPPDMDEVLDQVRSVDGVTAASYGTLFPAFDDPVVEETSGVGDSGGPWLVTFSAGTGAVGPVVLEGRAPSSADEVLLTRAIADGLGLEVGDTLVVHGRSFTAGDEGVATSKEVTLVGLGVLPVGDGDFERSLSMTFDGLQDLAPHARPDVVFIELGEGADVDGIREELATIGLSTDESPSGDIDVVELVDLDVRRADRVPTALGALMAVLAVGVLAHLVLTAVRTRQREFATLRSLGMRPRQIGQAVMWQVGIVMLVVSGLALSGGILIGREVWFHYARRLGVVPALSVPFVLLAVALAAFSAVAIVIARLAYWRQSRRPPGAVLRTE